MKFVTKQTLVGKALQVEWSDGTRRIYDAVELGILWFGMPNEEFFQRYCFDLNLPQYPKLFEYCKKIAHKN